ncbi:hypothetical protein HJ01_03333 [Flavobacterium frigoris PS1]|jgi:hypothetical protein|uniref:Uncharacterized protein n=1 Tax=Flavobacterium frigoris (strain PS1) TaxID=1086011 RepID=H7FW07_FLAFP|nr:hypothetical protein HJ01_03333 [Flavobacterium frigoris PS1]
MLHAHNGSAYASPPFWTYTTPHPYNRSLDFFFLFSGFLLKTIFAGDWRRNQNSSNLKKLTSWKSQDALQKMQQLEKLTRTMKWSISASS